MKRKMIFFCSVVILLILICINICDTSSQIRVRIIPSSNKTEDIQIKNEIRNLTIKYLQDNYDNIYNLYVQNIETSIDGFQDILKKYNAKAYFKYHTFYDKTYNDTSVKNECVLTFVVEIEEARGDNWWGIIYPKFLEIESTDTISYESFFVNKVKQWLGD